MSATAASAQSRWSLGIDYSALRTNLITPDDPTRAALNPLSSQGAGISLQWRIASRVALEVDAIYGAAGASWTSELANVRVESRIPMMQLPILAQVRLLNRGQLSLDATAGVAITRAANGRLIDRTYDQEFANFHTNQFGSAGVIGGQVSYNLKLPVRLAVRYVHGFSSVNPGEDTKLRGVNAILGLRILQW
ncbi:MAG: hypothetical protein ABJB66_19145 [Gemmatimonadaceae bacterium]